MTTGWSIQKFETVTSTQSVLKDTLAQNPSLQEGQVIISKNQTDGYGRHGRKWESKDGNLLFSFYLTPNCPIKRIGEISLLTSLALAETIKKYIDQPTTLKWPNDVLIENKKCSGVLLESIPSTENKNIALIIGIGVNTNIPADKNTTHLSHYKGDRLNNEVFLQDFLNSFSHLYQEWKDTGFKKIRALWLSKTYKKGSLMSVKNGATNISGKFEDIDNAGNLLILSEEKGEIQKISSGDVFLV